MQAIRGEKEEEEEEEEEKEEEKGEEVAEGKEEGFVDVSSSLYGTTGLHPRQVDQSRGALVSLSMSLSCCFSPSENGVPF